MSKCASRLALTVPRSVCVEPFTIALSSCVGPPSRFSAPFVSSIQLSLNVIVFLEATSAVPSNASASLSWMNRSACTARMMPLPLMPSRSGRLMVSMIRVFTFASMMVSFVIPCEAMIPCPSMMPLLLMMCPPVSVPPLSCTRSATLVFHCPVTLSVPLGLAVPSVPTCMILLP